MSLQSVASKESAEAEPDLIEVSVPTITKPADRFTLKKAKKKKIVIQHEEPKSAPESSKPEEEMIVTIDDDGDAATAASPPKNIRKTAIVSPSVSGTRARIGPSPKTSKGKAVVRIGLSSPQSPSRIASDRIPPMPARVITPPPSCVAMFSKSSQGIQRSDVRSGASQPLGATKLASVSGTSTPITSSTLQSILPVRNSRFQPGGGSGSSQSSLSPNAASSHPDSTPMFCNISLNQLKWMMRTNQLQKRNLEEKAEEVAKLTLALETEEKRFAEKYASLMEDLNNKQKIITEKEEELKAMAVELSLRESELESLRYSQPLSMPLTAFCPECSERW